MNKFCPKCNQNLDNSLFGRNINRKDGLSVYCKLCDKAYKRLHRKKNSKAYNKSALKYYYRNREKHNMLVMNNSKKYRKIARSKIIEYLKNHPCVDCGETNPIVLEFDHIKKKKYNISRMVQQGRTWNSITKEIEKCEIRCANCHRKRTAKQQKWNK